MLKETGEEKNRQGQVPGSVHLYRMELGKGYHKALGEKTRRRTTNSDIL